MLKKLSYFGVLCASVFALSQSAEAQRRGDDGRDRTKTVLCESLNNAPNRCFVGRNDGVQIERQISRAGCSYGRTWGYDRDSIWVDGGCRAYFRVTDRGHRPDPRPEPGPRPETIECSSLDYKYTSCYVGRGLERAELAQVHSKSACVYNRSWGYNRDSVWVNQGCRATFRVYKRRGGRD